MKKINNYNKNIEKEYNNKQKLQNKQNIIIINEIGKIKDKSTMINTVKESKDFINTNHIYKTNKNNVRNNKKIIII